MLSEGLRPEVLVFDHLMPGTNGTVFARKAPELMPDMHALIVSGYAETEGIAPDLPLLVKLFRQSELAASLSNGRRLTLCAPPFLKAS